ncbi:hypothetical protein [Robbsia andropogonis]|nr:hypothetical protein [Robbsia andropogonis]
MAISIESRQIGGTGLAVTALGVGGAPFGNLLRSMALSDGHCHVVEAFG